jgi:polysaccharide chain length determinant protein (PEP-CTERM system associated)
MHPALDHVFDEVRGAWRFRWFALGTAFLVAIAGWLVVFALPDRYESSARVFVDTRTALKPALQGLTIDQNVEGQINFVHQSLLAPLELERIAMESGLLPNTVTDPSAKAKILDAMSTRISLNVYSAGNQGDDRSSAGTIYAFDYRDTDRERSLKVVGILLNTFIQETLGGKRAGSENAQKFLEAQIKDYEHRLSAAEDRIADFKKKNLGLLPSDQGSYFTNLQTEVDAEKKAETDLSIAVSRRDELSNQLHGDAAVSAAGVTGAVVNAQGVASGGDTLSRIQETQAKLDELLLKYTDKHPDVIATRATLAELEQRRAEELQSLRHGDAAAVAASGAGANPVYQSIQLELNKEEVNIAALRREVAQHQQTVADMRQRLNSAPQVEAEFQQLSRDYDVNKSEYASLLESYQKARMGEQADNAGSVRFEVVLPPTASPTPVWPRRNLFIVAVWAAAMAAGAAVAYGLHTLRPIVASVSGIKSLTNFPVLGVVGGAFPTQQGSAFRGRIASFSAVAMVLVLCLGMAMVLNRSGVRLNLHALSSLVRA